MPGQGAGPLPARGGGRSRPAANDKEQGRELQSGSVCAATHGMHKAPVPAPQDTPPLGTKCVLCQPSSLPSRCSCHCSICSGERPGGPAQGRKPSSEQIPVLCRALSQMSLELTLADWPLAVAHFALPCRHPQNLPTCTPTSPTFIAYPSNNRYLYYVPVFKVIHAHYVLGMA